MPAIQGIFSHLAHTNFASAALLCTEGVPGLDMSLWEAWYVQDGVTVFFGTGSENEGVIMVSLIVHAPPSLVTEVGIKSQHGSTSSTNLRIERGRGTCWERVAHCQEPESAAEASIMSIAPRKSPRRQGHKALSCRQPWHDGMCEGPLKLIKAG
jgi:hypothetical protein